MRQLTVEDLLAEAAGPPAGRWVAAEGPRGLVGITTARPAPHCPERVVVIGCSLTAYRWGCPPRPREIYLRPEDLREIDPAGLPPEVATAVEEAWRAAQRERLEVC